MAKLGTLTATQVITAAELNVGAGAWSTWVPAYTNLTVGNGTVTAKYGAFGRSIFFKWALLLGTTSAVGTAPTVTVPLTMADTLDAYTFRGAFYDTATGIYPLFTHYISSTVFQLNAVNTASTYGIEAGASATIPIALGSADLIVVSGTFEATS